MGNKQASNLEKNKQPKDDLSEIGYNKGSDQVGTDSKKGCLGDKRYLNSLDSDTIIPVDKDTNEVNDDRIDLIIEKLNDIKESAEKIHNEFQSKLRYDNYKEKIIDKLHSELQEYKNRLIKRILQPTILDIIYEIDEIKKLTNHYNNQEESELNPQKLLKQLEDIPDDLEDILYKQGVGPFRGKDETIFDPTCQRVLKTLTTNDKSKDKTVAKSVRNGYKWDGKVIRPEMVEVYVYKNHKINKEKVKSDNNGGKKDNE